MNLTRQQIAKLEKLSPYSLKDAIIRVSEIDGWASVTWWTSVRSWHEIVITPRGRVTTNHRSTI